MGFINPSIQLIPKSAADIALGIGRLSRQRLENIVLNQKVLAHVRAAEAFGQHASALLRRKVDPQVFARNGHGGQKIFDELLRFALDLGFG